MKGLCVSLLFLSLLAAPALAKDKDKKDEEHPRPKQCPNHNGGKDPCPAAAAKAIPVCLVVWKELPEVGGNLAETTHFEIVNATCITGGNEARNLCDIKSVVSGNGTQRTLECTYDTEEEVELDEVLAKKSAAIFTCESTSGYPVSQRQAEGHPPTVICGEIPAYNGCTAKFGIDTEGKKWVRKKCTPNAGNVRYILKSNPCINKKEDKVVECFCHYPDCNRVFTDYDQALKIANKGTTKNINPVAALFLAIIPLMTFVATLN